MSFPAKLYAPTAACLGLAVCLASSASARAEEEELRLMNEPTSFTDVVDAFDDHDPFDLDLTLGYERTWEFGRIQRESPSTSGTEWRDLGNFSREVNQLLIGLDVGLYRDLALYSQVPLMLSDDRMLTPVGSESATLLLDRTAGGAPLFDLPASGFRSPTRSGVDWISAGLAWSVLNQARDPHVPTWMWMIEGRFNVGQGMHACAAVGQCLTNATADDARTGVLLRGSDAGVGRGVNALRIETRASYRFAFLEPYVGFAFQASFPGNAAPAFSEGGALPGYVHKMPPLVGRVTVGSAFVPWEDRARWQRVTVDLRCLGEFSSAGLEYTPLFDALGGSTNPALAQPQLDGVARAAGASNLSRVHFAGLLDVDERARLGAQLGIEIGVARYVRFRVAGGLYHTPSYVLTHAEPCNAGVSAAADDPRRGACRAGVVDGHYRGAIDSPGQRFRAESTTQVDLSAFATAQF
jgi:hypothetical protein